jgi:hypothetical protein
MVMILSILVGCSLSVSSAELAAVDYTPIAEVDWQVLIPEEHGLNPELVAELYYNASELETLYGLLV